MAPINKYIFPARGSSAPGASWPTWLQLQLHFQLHFHFQLQLDSLRPPLFAGPSGRWRGNLVALGEFGSLAVTMIPMANFAAARPPGSYKTSERATKSNEHESCFTSIVIRLPRSLAFELSGRRLGVSCQFALLAGAFRRSRCCLKLVGLRGQRQINGVQWMQFGLCGMHMSQPASQPTSQPASQSRVQWSPIYQ